MPRFALLVAALALVVSGKPARADLYTLSTAEHPVTSILTLTLGVATTDFKGSIGPTEMHGTMIADISLTEPNDDGTVEILSTDFDVDSIGPTTIDLGAVFGKMDLELVNLHYFLSMGPRTVTNNGFLIDGTATGTFGFDSGLFKLTNAQGLLAVLLGPDPDDIDLSTDPAVGEYADLVNPFNGTVDDDAGLLDSDGAEINFPLGVSIDLGSGFYLLIENRISVGSAVPEASTFVLTGTAIASLCGIVVARRRRHE